MLAIPDANADTVLLLDNRVLPNCMQGCYQDFNRGFIEEAARPTLVNIGNQMHFGKDR